MYTSRLFPSPDFGPLRRELPSPTSSCPRRGARGTDGGAEILFRPWLGAGR